MEGKSDISLHPLSYGLICVSPPFFPGRPPWNPPAEMMTSSDQLYRNKGQAQAEFPQGVSFSSWHGPGYRLILCTDLGTGSSALILPLIFIKLEKYALKCQIKGKTMKKYVLDQCERSIWTISRLESGKNGRWGGVWHQDRRTQLLSGSTTFHIETFLEV